MHLCRFNLGGSATRVISDKIDMEVNQVQFSLSIRSLIYLKNAKYSYILGQREYYLP